MKIKSSLLIALSLSALTLIACSPSSSEPSVAEKKAFLGSAPPKGYMSGVGAGQKAAQDAASKAAASNGAK